MDTANQNDISDDKFSNFERAQPYSSNSTVFVFYTDIAPPENQTTPQHRLRLPGRPKAVPGEQFWGDINVRGGVTALNASDSRVWEVVI